MNDSNVVDAPRNQKLRYALTHCDDSSRLLHCPQRCKGCLVRRRHEDAATPIARRIVERVVELYGGNVDFHRVQGFKQRLGGETSVFPCPSFMDSGEGAALANKCQLLCSHHRLLSLPRNHSRAARTTHVMQSTASQVAMTLSSVILHSARQVVALYAVAWPSLRMACVTPRWSLKLWLMSHQAGHAGCWLLSQFLKGLVDADPTPRRPTSTPPGSPFVVFAQRVRDAAMVYPDEVFAPPHFSLTRHVMHVSGAPGASSSYSSGATASPGPMHSVVSHPPLYLSHACEISGG